LPALPLSRWRSSPTSKRVRELRTAELRVLQRILESAGVEFIGEVGVKLKTPQ
jgi:hypothetical protein